MKKYSLEFKLLLVFISVELILFLLSFTEIFNLLHSLTISLFTCLVLTIYFIIRREKIPINLSLKLSRIVFITFFGALFLLNVFVITGGMSKITVPFFITGIAVIMFADMESLGIVKTFYGQKNSDLDDLKIKNKFLSLIMILSIIWPLISLSGALIYSRFPENFEFLKKIEFPLSNPLMAVSDSDGNIYIDTGFYCRIQKYDKDGHFLYGFDYGTPGNTELIIDEHNRLYIGTYSSQNILRVFSSSGEKLYEISSPEEDITSWFLEKGGHVQSLWNNKIVLNDTVMPVREGSYLFTGTRFAGKIFQDIKGNRYIISRNLFCPSVYRENLNGIKDLTIVPKPLTYVFTIPFPSLVIPLFIMLLLSGKKEKKENE
ncbi:MAG: hypothetical protein ABRQ38_25015 [Candidatus Eremiobacterota bacterium]